MRFRILETASSLIVSYEILALEYNRAKIRRSSIVGIAEPESQDDSSNHFNNFNITFSLLNLNASIIEGALRSILSEQLNYDINKSVEKGMREGNTEPTAQERLLYKFRDEVEAQGGWERLKEQYSVYLKLSLNEITSADVKEGLDVLFALRNIIAHGTAIVYPKTNMENDLKDVYPYSWQRKLQRVRVYMKKHFGHEDIFDNLSEYGVPEHFLNITKEFAKDIEKAIEPLPERGKLTLDKIKQYSFAKICFSR